MKVVIIQSLLSPYRYPLFDVLSYVYDLSVWFMGRRVKNRVWNISDIKYHLFKYRFLSGVTLNIGIEDNYPFWINLTTPIEIYKTKPQVVVIFGWDSLTSFLVVYFRFMYPSTKIIIFSESTKYELSWRRDITKPLVRSMLSRVDFCLAAGDRASSYLETLGVAGNKIAIAPTTNDVDKYVYLTDKYKKQREALRNAMGYNENDVVVMFYGQLIKRKGVDLLVEAYSRLTQTCGYLKLLIIGDGKLLPDLIKKVSDLNLSDVTILPNPGDHAICKYYASADIFVLPSRNDTWGLVVNEAMCSGLPVIVSDKVGSGSELVKEGENGFVFKSDDVDDLVRVVNKLAEDEGLRRKFGKASSKIIQNFRPENTLKGYVEAIGRTIDLALGPSTYRNIKFLKDKKADFASVIIPVFNDPAGLEATLSSLFVSGVEKRAEIIVANDGGYETVSNVCGKYKVFEVKTKYRKGSYNARNLAVSSSCGEKILFVDAGTAVGKNWFDAAVSTLKDCDYVGGPINVTGGGGFLNVFEREREFPVREFMEDMNFAPTTNLGITRQLIETVGGFDARLESSGDYEFGNRVFLKAGYTQIFNEKMVVYHHPRNFKDMLIKQKRLAKGFVDLGRYYPDRFVGIKKSLIVSLIKAVIPPFWLFFKNSWRKLSFSDKIPVFLFSYIFSFIQHVFFAGYIFKSIIKPRVKVHAQ